MHIKPVLTDPDIRIVADLAHEIWNEHFPAIIGQAQVDYMVATLQSQDAIARQIRDGAVQYYLFVDGQTPVGYLAVRPEPAQQRMFLSKLYVRKSCRGRGLARIGMEFVEDRCRREGLGVLWLTVNRGNHVAIAAYERMGLVKTGAVVADIGHGFVMDDFRMEKSVIRPS